jgi:cell division protease FtsH
LERITRIAYDMITVYGMDEKIGHLSFRDSEGEYNFKDPYSEETAVLIDKEVRDLIDKAYKRTKKILKSKKDILERVAQTLLEKEVLFKKDLEKLIGTPPITSQAHERDGKGEKADVQAAEKTQQRKSKKSKPASESSDNNEPKKKDKKQDSQQSKSKTSKNKSSRKKSKKKNKPSSQQKSSSKNKGSKG